MGIYSKIQGRNPMGKILAFLLFVLLGFGFVCLGEITQDSFVIAQSPPTTSPDSSTRVEDVAVIIYQKLPYLPKENQYISKEKGEIDPQHTLISRLIRYHQDLKKRATRYRLDWKLTLADYLGVNEVIDPDRYPGSISLTSNPATTDIKAIQVLNRRQRQELVDLLAQLYKPKVAAAPANPANPANPSNPNVPATPKPSPTVDPGKPSLAKPGDAQLLMP